MKNPVATTKQDTASPAAASRTPERPGPAASKNAGGNQNLGRILRKAASGGSAPGAGAIAKAYRGNNSAAASGLLSRGASTGSRLEAPVAKTASEKLGADVSDVRVHTGSFADRAARELNADAFSFGQDVYFRDGRYAPESGKGRDLLHHELAHTVQHRQGMLGQSESLLERHADQMTARGFSDFARPNAAAAPRILRKGTGAKCTSVAIVLPGTIIFYGTEGPIKMTVALDQDVPPGEYQIHYDQSQGSLLLEPWPNGNLVLTVAGTTKGTKTQIKAQEDLWDSYLNSLTDKVKLTVSGGGNATGSSAGDPGKGPGAGGGGDAKGAKAPGQDKTDAPPPGGGGIKGGTGTKDVPGGTDPKAQGKTPGGTVKEGGDPSGPPGPDVAPTPDVKGPVIQITDAKQIDELKKRGLLEPKTADDIKAKVDKQESLTFEEAIALLDAMDKVAQKDPKSKSNTSKESWLKWARFIQENKDKISGKANISDKGITVDEMKELLAKYHEFVGIQGAPPADKDKKDKDYDVTKRKSWNELAQWEKDLWTQYVAKYGNPGGSDSDDMHLTAATKFSMALRMSPNYMPEGAHDAAVQLFNDPIFIVSTMAGITLYVAAWLAPEPLFSKATAATITIALLTIFSVSEIKNAAVAWSRLGDETENATTLPELEAAAEHFGKAIGGIGLRVLVMIATILLGKALPGPKALPPGEGGGGFGGMKPATVGGPPVAAAAATEGVAIKVLADGTILVLPAAGAQNVVSMAAGKGGGGGGGSGPKPKDPEVPEDTHGLRDTPGGKAPSEGKEVGNFAHKYFERLKSFLPKNSNVVSEDVPPGAEAEYEIKGPNYEPGRGPRIDRLDRAGHTVIEIKPHGLYDQGLAEAKAYAQTMDKLEPLPNGQKWQAKCITYDYDAVMAYLRSIGYLK